MPSSCALGYGVRKVVPPFLYFSAGTLFAAVCLRNDGDARTCNGQVESPKALDSSQVGLFWHLAADEADISFLQHGQRVSPRIGNVLLQKTAGKRASTKVEEEHLPYAAFLEIDSSDSKRNVSEGMNLKVTPSSWKDDISNVDSRGQVLLGRYPLRQPESKRAGSDQVRIPDSWPEDMSSANEAGRVGPLAAAMCGGMVLGVALTMLIISAVGDFKMKVTGGHRPGSRQRMGSWDTSEEHESLHLFWPRCGCLVLLMLIQSLSSFIIDGFGSLFQANPSLVHFLTMVVGTGGNVGAQSVVLAVRKLALGERVSVAKETFVGLQLSTVLVTLAFCRCLFQGVELSASIVISTSILAIILTSAALGTAIPKSLYFVKVDPAHATPTIQVLMDILGVFVVCIIGRMILGFGAQ